MREPRVDVPVARPPLSAVMAVAICLLATLYLGVFPGRVLEFTMRSASQIAQPAGPPMATARSLNFRN